MEVVKVGELSEVPLGKMKMFKVGEKEYLVANVNGHCRARSYHVTRGLKVRFRLP